MNALEDIRKKQSEIEIQFRPIVEMYSLLEIYLPQEMNSEEADASTLLEKEWSHLVSGAVGIRNDLQG